MKATDFPILKAGLLGPSLILCPTPLNTFYILQIELFNKSEADILEMLCDPNKLKDILKAPSEYTPINVTDISRQFCDPEIASEIKSGIDVSKGIYKVLKFSSIILS